ncbi:hypothetical protein RRG08_009612 [Elysia crispata]|uniref:Uncharacterized protein n=1 Tax=Elysia crispata TaxID=231223 RepID=A0AAE0XTM8_9GAST|nr:hypothetical protein RRG08_009612 [Elysia crispata]
MRTLSRKSDSLLSTMLVPTFLVKSPDSRTLTVSRVERGVVVTQSGARCCSNSNYDGHGLSRRFWSSHLTAERSAVL